MASQAEREKARRFEIERAFVMPEPRHDWADASPFDRPSATIDRIVAACRALGWTIQEKSRLDWHAPKWVSVDGGPSVYKAAPRVQYHLFAQHPNIDMSLIEKRKYGKAYVLGAPEGKPLALDLVMIDGRKERLRFGVGGELRWQPSTIALTSIAKTITETGVPA